MDSPDTVTPIGPEAVTERQREVARLIAAGRTNPQIADDLGITLDGAKYHVSELLVRLGLERREEVARWYRAHYGPVARIRARLGLPPLLFWGGAGAVLIGVAAAAVVMFGLTSETPRAIVPAQDEPPSDGVFASMLRSVPDDPHLREAVVMVDLALIRERAGIEPPADTTGEAAYQQAINEWLQENGLPRSFSLTGPFDWFLGITENGDIPPASERTSRSLGFGFRDTDGALVAGAHPPVHFHLITGAFNPNAVDDTLAECAECPAPDRTDAGGVTIYSWGDGLRQDIMGRLGPPIFDDLGRGGYVAVMDDRVIRSFELPTTTAAVEGARGGLSLIDDPDWSEVVEALDAMGLVAIDLTDQVTTASMRERAPGGADQDRVDEAWATDGRYALLDAYTLIGAGVGAKDAAPFTTFVLAFPDEATATRNVDLARSRLEDLPTSLPGWEETWSAVYDTLEVRADGRLLIVTMRGFAALGPYQIGEPLFLIDPAQAGG